jgi:MFS family permease
MLGYSALDSGLATFPQALGIILVSRIVGRVYHTIGPRRLVTFGLIACSLCSLPMAFVSLDVSSWTIRALMLGRGLSMAFAFVPLQAATYANITPSDTGRASAIFSTQRQVSAALGVAILSTAYISLSNHNGGEVTIDDRLTGFHWAFLGSVLLMFAGGVVAYFVLRDSDAASTMHPQPAKH